MTDRLNRVVVEDVPHSSRGASSAYRWLNCPGQIALAEQVLRRGGDLRESGPAAAEGTAAHTIAAAALDEGVDAWEYTGITVCVSDYEFEVDEEMVEGVQLYLDEVRNRVASYREQGHDVHVHVEKPLQSMTDPDAFGTPDTLIHVPAVALDVIDFKYGKKIVCEPDSEQTKYYGYLGLETYVAEVPPERVGLGIVQPRLPHPRGLVRWYEDESAESLEAWWYDVVLPGIDRTRDSDAAFLKVGEWCRFCPARGHCPALKGDTSEFPLDMDPSFLTGEELGALLDKAKAISSYWKTCLEPLAYMRVMSGEEVAGYKLVRKQAARVFKKSMVVRQGTDNHPEKMTVETAAREAFGDDAFTEPELLSPAQMEKIPGGKHFVSKWSYTPDTGLTIAPASDKREPVRRLMDEFISRRGESAEHQT